VLRTRLGLPGDTNGALERRPGLSATLCQYVRPLSDNLWVCAVRRPVVLGGALLRRSDVVHDRPGTPGHLPGVSPRGVVSPSTTHVRRAPGRLVLPRPRMAPSPVRFSGGVDRPGRSPGHLRERRANPRLVCAVAGRRGTGLGVGFPERFRGAAVPLRSLQEPRELEGAQNADVSARVPRAVLVGLAAGGEDGQRPCRDDGVEL
jgi:hypothetical protein